MNTITLKASQVKVIGGNPFMSLNAPVVDSGNSAPPSITPIKVKRSGLSEQTLTGAQVNVPLYAPGGDFNMSCAEGDTKIVVVGGTYDGYLGFFHF